MTIKMYTTPSCPDCHAAKRLLNEHGLSFVEINMQTEPDAIDLVMRLNKGKRSVPTFVIENESGEINKTFNCSPFSAAQLKSELGLS